jgi:ABC-type Fe3+-hydroxamate transport system substrate-binding protein
MTVDDLGAHVELPSRPARVVSLVPSITESIALTCPDLLVAATDWCTHPAGLDVVRIRGTKNPDCRAIIALAPDLVVANMEESREIDVRRLRDAGVPVWVTRIETLDESFAALRRLFTLALEVEIPRWLLEAEAIWTAPATPSTTRVGVAIWRDPWMVVGSSTFTGDLVSRLGVVNAFADHPFRYPAVSLDELQSEADLVLLPDEPYAFTADDGPQALPQVRTALVSGRDLTWYGPSLVEARARLTTAIAAALRT